MPPLKDGWVRLIHRTQPDCATSILDSGLRGKFGISGTTTLHDKDGFWKNLETDRLTFYGSKKVVMDMPAREYTKLFYNDGYYKKGSIIDDTGYHNARNLYVKNKYIVGIIDSYGIRKPLTPKQLESMKRSSQLNPFLDIKPEDLRQLNPGRPSTRDWCGRTPSEARKELEKAQKEIVSRKNNSDTYIDEVHLECKIKPSQNKKLSVDEVFEDLWQ